MGVKNFPLKCVCGKIFGTPGNIFLKYEKRNTGFGFLLLFSQAWGTFIILLYYSLSRGEPPPPPPLPIYMCLVSLGYKFEVTSFWHLLPWKKTSLQKTPTVVDVH